MEFRVEEENILVGTLCFAFIVCAGVIIYWQTLYDIQDIQDISGYIEEEAMNR